MNDMERIVERIKAEGCRVRVYDRPYVYNGTAVGLFDLDKKGRPIISIAGREPNKVELNHIALHELGHFLQWRDGMCKKIEPHGEGTLIFDKWVEGQEFDKKTLRYARRATLILEYDADCRAIDLGKELDVRMYSDEDAYNIAHSYITSIKRDFEMRRSAVHYPHMHIMPRKMSRKEVLAPLTDGERISLEMASSKYRIKYL